jgi:catechol 2,3-dioxygenase-like lactoylglutathione lyase family enzyme
LALAEIGPGAEGRQMNLNHVTVSVTAMAPALDFYRLLGLKLIVLNDHYARFEVPEGDATFSIELADSVASGNTPQLFFECGDIDAQAARLAAAGVAFELPPTDMPWLWRQAHMRDPSGNLICLFRAGEIRKQPPWRLPDERAS